MAGNQVTLEIAGDATDLQRAAAQAEQAMAEVEEAVADTNNAMQEGASQSQDFGTRLGNLGNAVDGASTAIGDAAGAVQAFADIQNMAAERAQRLGRALNDVKQAQQDYNQAILDGKQAQLDIGQAQIDAEQAALDASEAQKAYNEAVAEHGANSAEARQAAIDLKQANADLAQAGYDVEQAMADQTQSTIDAEAAQLDLNEAQAEANPTQLQKVADTINLLTPIMAGLIGIIGLVTAAQWAWNAAMSANPVGLIIVGIALLVAAIVLIATKTTWFQDLWKAVWGGIVAYINWVKDNYVKAFRFMIDAGQWLIDKVTSIPRLISQAFSGLFSILTAPWRAAFNFIADAWNNTVGRLSWTVPSWVPGVGGKGISAPKLPKFHEGGVVPGVPGSEMLAILQAGERVVPAGEAQRIVLELKGDNGALVAALIELLAGGVRARGGTSDVLGITNG